MENNTKRHIKVTKRPVRVCPKCGKEYNDYPALSRRDNKTLICPECGVREALEDAGLL